MALHIVFRAVMESETSPSKVKSFDSVEEATRPELLLRHSQPRTCFMSLGALGPLGPAAVTSNVVGEVPYLASGRCLEFSQARRRCLRQARWCCFPNPPGRKPPLTEAFHRPGRCLEMCGRPWRLAPWIRQGPLRSFVGWPMMPHIFAVIGSMAGRKEGSRALHRR